MLTCKACNHPLTQIQVGSYWAWQCLVLTCKQQKWPTGGKPAETKTEQTRHGSAGPVLSGCH